jgi:esterase/lipase/1-acyl-sn-glycerol-3-phosphate acyltransferase
MNKFAFRTTGILIKALYNLSKATFYLHDQDRIPDGPVIFVVNHFTRLETFLFPYVVYTLTKKPVWSLAAADLFRGAFGEYLEKVGALSNKDPNRDQLMVKSLLTDETNWIIFPEGRMVKNKKIFEKGRFIVSHAGGKHSPHTGAATLALRTEFYRRRILALDETNPGEAGRLLSLFNIGGIEKIGRNAVTIVPVNISYYPLRARENILSKMAVSLMGNPPERLIEELMTEGAMLLSGVDIDIRFGDPIDIGSRIEREGVAKDVKARDAFGFDDDIPSKKILYRDALGIMNEYMTAIYGMTTVNHDHLFASVLRQMPWRTIEEADLRRRVFLISDSRFREKLYRHRSLEESQIPLITDDRFGKYDDFLDLAIERRVLNRKDGRLVKNRLRLNRMFDFNRIRIENPIAVMANDVEPLGELQRTIRHFSRQGRWRIRRKVAEVIRKQEEADFEKDFSRYYRAGVSKPKSIGRPFLLKGNLKRNGVLLIHGYMAAPAEMAPLAAFLNRQGYWVYGVRISGHGTDPEDLAGKKYQDWISSVDAGYGLISSLCRKVVVGGFSAGGGLALEIASRIMRMDGVFAVCPPARLRNPLSRLAPGMDVLKKSLGILKMGGMVKTFAENRPENPGINYLQNPISGVHQLEKLMEMVSERVGRVEKPVLVVQSQGDPVVDPLGTKVLFEKIGSSEKSYEVLDFDRHGILLGAGSETVHRLIGEYCGKILSL